MSRVTVHFRGSLRSVHPEPIPLVVETVAEALQALSAQLPGLRPDANGYKRVRVKDFDTEASLYEPLEGDIELHIFPQMNGGKNGGWVQVLVGSVLIGAALLITGGLAGLAAAGSALAAGGASFAQFMAITLFMTGVSTTIGGLLTMLMPAPSMDGQKAAEGSKYLGVPGSTVAIGTTIRVIYGLRRVGFHIIAVNVNARNYAP